MKKVLRFLGYTVAALLTVIVLALIIVYAASNSKLKKKFVVTVQPVVIPTDADSLARGHHIASTRGCLVCHGPDGGGAMVIENPAMGKVHGPNLTHGVCGLPADWKDVDYVRAIRHGVTPDGRGLFLMPSTEYSTFSDADMGSLIAYLKTLPSVDRPSGPVAPGPVARGLMLAGQIKLAAEVIDHANVLPATVTRGITVEYGRYLATGCSGCHGDNFSGGKIKIGPPDWPPAANLTPHAEGRISKWTEDDFLRALRTAKRPDGTELNSVMPRIFGNLDDVELKAIWAFFKTLPAAPTGSHP